MAVRSFGGHGDRTLNRSHSYSLPKEVPGNGGRKWRESKSQPEKQQDPTQNTSEINKKGWEYSTGLSAAKPNKQINACLTVFS